MAVLLEVLGTSFIPVIQNQLSPCLHQSCNFPSLPSAVEGVGYCVAPDVRPAVWLSAVSFPEQISETHGKFFQIAHRHPLGV